MFEKEAEEYRKDLKSKFFLSEPQLDLACQGFKDGYNKANEWHYDKNVPCYKTGTYRIIIYDNWREPTIISPTQELEHISGQENHIIAWKEIVLPELKESE